MVEMLLVEALQWSNKQKLSAIDEDEHCNVMVWRFCVAMMSHNKTHVLKAVIRAIFKHNLLKEKLAEVLTAIRFACGYAKSRSSNVSFSHEVYRGDPDTVSNGGWVLLEALVTEYQYHHRQGNPLADSVPDPGKKEIMSFVVAYWFEKRSTTTHSMYVPDDQDCSILNVLKCVSDDIPQQEIHFMTSILINDLKNLTHTSDYITVVCSLLYVLYTPHSDDKVSLQMIREISRDLLCIAYIPTFTS
jgi:hypothetical protein